MPALLTPPRISPTATSAERQEAARQTYRQSVADGHPLTGVELAGEEELAWLLPITVDGLIAAADPELVDPATLRRVVCAWPPIAFALSFELWLQLIRPDQPEAAR